MSDYPKYRLKKDTPEFKAGSVFTRRKYDYGDYDDDFLFADISPGTSPVPAFDISLIDDFDEWFEDLGSQKWTQKQIKQIEFGENKSIYVVVRFIKEQRYIYNDKEFGDCVSCNEVGEIKKIYFGANESKFWQQEDCDILNQMVRDGYIEIKDNPNIVWEDEKCD